MPKQKKIVILGSTGSIGESAFWVVQQLKEQIKVVGLAAGTRWERLAEQSRALGVGHAAIAAPEHLNSLRNAVGPEVTVSADPAGLIDMVTAPDVDMVLCAITGTGGFEPVLAAIRAGKDIALASKEILVMAGDLVMSEVKKHGVRMIPVDSEHSAIFQCLEGRDMGTVRKLTLTASGGPFRNTPASQLAAITPEQALAHPTWNMGPKITIDSATLFNKALEVIEARWLFGVVGDQIDVVVHPQSIIHSMVEFIDGGMLAQLGLPDMKLPIQYALLFPERVDTGLPRCDLPSLGALTFEQPRHDVFPALRLAHDALAAGGTMPTALNAANEVAVDAFRRGHLSFTGISTVVEATMSACPLLSQNSLAEIKEADTVSRKKARELIA
ncbi:MAG: 1-deoxy-D-xylulose-5-phosphate reductoisomerase [Lentisphaeria bacterium]|nr:1-deoxy-D-xylulose-5-phosphate reductoisomerase [Lentisphaeria bacterium]